MIVLLNLDTNDVMRSPEIKARIIDLQTKRSQSRSEVRAVFSNPNRKKTLNQQHADRFGDASSPMA